MPLLGMPPTGALVAHLPGACAVKISVTFCDIALTLAALHVEPSWLERILFGRVELDDLVTAVPSIAGGRLWIFDSTGRRVRNARIVAAIESARQRAEREQRVA